MNVVVLNSLPFYLDRETGALFPVFAGGVDNTTLNSGSGGDTIATDDIGGVKYQRVKITLGADGAADGDVSSSLAMPTSDTATKVDDAAFTPATSRVMMVGAEFDDTTPDSVDEGDAGALRMSANRCLYVKIRDNAGNERGLNVDASGNIGVTDASGTLSVDDGAGSLTVDNATLSVVGGGVEASALRVTIASDSTGVVSVDDNGGNLSVDDGGGSITVDGTVSVSGTVTVDSELTTADLDTGAGTDTRAVVGLVGSASGGGQLIPGSSTDGLLVNLGANNDVTVTGTVTANLAAGTNNIGDVDVLSVVPGTSATSLGKAEDAAHSSGDTGVMALGVRAASPTDRSAGPTDGDYEPFAVNEKGAVWVTPTPSANGGCSVFLSIDLDESEEEVKASAGTVYGCWVTNTATSTRWLKFYNATAASVVVGTTTPVMVIGIPGNSSDDISGNFNVGTVGVKFDTAITVAATTGVAHSDTGAPGANEVIVNIYYL